MAIADLPVWFRVHMPGILPPDIVFFSQGLVYFGDNFGDENGKRKVQVAV
ncbi:MAG TPA: hypothetical protein VJB11_01330 [archaeon]|nr:hypothetical protein [archaeon]